MLHKLYRIKWLIRLVSSHTFMIVLACLLAFLGSFQRAAEGAITQEEALMFSAGAWFIGAYVLVLRLVKKIARKW